MANEFVEKSAALQTDIEENVTPAKQGHTILADFKVPGDAPAISPQNTTVKLDSAAPGVDVGVDAAVGERWLTGKKLALVHTAMLLSFVVMICNGQRADNANFQVLPFRA